MSEHTDCTALHLPAVMDTQAAPALLRILVDQRGMDLTLDGSAVQRLGGQCLQVLLSAEATWRADGCTVSITRPSPELQAAFALLGVDPASSLLQQEHCP